MADRWRPGGCTCPGFPAFTARSNTTAGNADRGSISDDFPAGARTACSPLDQRPTQILLRPGSCLICLGRRACLRCRRWIWPLDGSTTWSFAAGHFLQDSICTVLWSRRPRAMPCTRAAGSAFGKGDVRGTLQSRFHPRHVIYVDRSLLHTVHLSHGGRCQYVPSCRNTTGCSSW